MAAEPTLASLLQSVHRLGHEPPAVIAQLGWRYRHIEWMRYAADSPLHPAIKSLPHVAC